MATSLALRWLIGGALFASGSAALAGERPDCEYQIFQFAPDAIPRIDGQTDDWSAVDGDYVIGSDRLKITDGSDESPTPDNLDVRVRVGWVKGMNRLYILYEATDDYWDFAERGLHNDTFELVVDGNRSGGPLIARFHPDLPPEGADPASARYISAEDAWFSFQNIHAQNYHIFTPAFQKDWAMAWGPQASWIKRLPWSNIAYDYSFRHGEGGRLVAEFWITPFDHADPTGPERSVESVLTENGVVGMAWAVIDYDGPNTRRRHFWNLSPHHTMYGQASQLCSFRLMPIEASQQQAVEAAWSFTILDRERRAVAFQDQTSGTVTEWLWDFGDGTRSTEQHPVHLYAEPGKFVVTLDVSGPDGRSSHSKVWDVSFAGDPRK